MLILMRQKGEQIYIDRGRIKIEIVQLDGDVAAVGIRAPAHIDVDRKEVFLQKILKQQKKNRLLHAKDEQVKKEFL